MRFAALFSALVALAAGCSVQAAGSQAPRFEPLFVGSLALGSFQNLTGPFGTRIHAASTGGNLTDTSGKLVGTILPTADTGIVSDSGIFFPEAVLPVVWEVDQKLAILQLTGVGELFKSDLVYIHLETDSETYKSLNSRFLIANVTFGATGNPIFDIFGAL